MKYKSFLSYSHKDLQTVNWLHRRLDGYKPPRRTGAPSEARWRIFLDREELGASSNLPKRIERALDESETLVVVCSPDAARSRYVNMEIAYFRQFTDRTILFAIVDGTPHGINDECMPAELGKLPHEPLGVDLRKNDSSEAFLKIVSGIMGIDYGDLANRERKRSIRRTVVGACIVGVVLVAVATAALVAVTQTASVADRIAEAKALRGLRYAENQDNENAERMFRDSLYISDSQLARQGLIRTLQKPITRMAHWVSEGDQFTSVAFVSESRIALGDKAGRVRLVDPSEGAELWSNLPVGSDVGAVSPQAINDLIYDRTADRIIAASESGLLFWLDPATGVSEDSYDTGHAVLSLRQSVDTGLLALGTRGGLLVLDRDNKVVIDMIHSHSGTVQGLAFNDSGNTIYWGGSTKRIWACQIDDSPCQQLQYVDEWVYSVDTDRVGRFSAYSEGGKLTVLDHFLREGEVIARGGAHVFALRFDPSGNLLIAGDSGGRISVYDVRARSLVQSVATGDGEIYDIDISSSDERFASAGLNGSVSLWQVSRTIVAAPTYSKLGVRNPVMLAREQPTAIHDIRIFDEYSAAVIDSQTRQHVLPLELGAEPTEKEEDGLLIAERTLRSQRGSYSRAFAATEIDSVSAWRELYPARAKALDALAEDRNILRTATSGDTRMLAIAELDVLKVFSADSDTPRTTLVDLRGVTSLAIGDLGDVVYLGTENGGIEVLSINGGEFTGQVDCDGSNVFAIFAVAGGAGAIAATANGTLCFIRKDGRITERVETSVAIAFAASPELDAVAIAGVEGTVSLFTSELELVTEFKGHRGSVNALHFSVDGQVLYSGGEDEVLRSWPAGEAVSIHTKPLGMFSFSDLGLDRRALHGELPALWPLLRYVGYL